MIDLGAMVARLVTINRPDVVALIEAAAQRFTGGNKTEAVALALRRLNESATGSGSLFGGQRGPVTVREGVDPIALVLEDIMDAETGRMP